MPVDALEAHVRVVLLEAEVHGGAKADVWALDGMHVIAVHLELRMVEVLGEHLHLLD